MRGLTASQRAALAVLDRAYRNGPELRRRYAGFGQSPTPPIEGLHATLASLVRRGLATKAKIRGAVCYEITDEGVRAR